MRSHAVGRRSIRRSANDRHHQMRRHRHRRIHARAHRPSRRGVCAVRSASDWPPRRTPARSPRYRQQIAESRAGPTDAHLERRHAGARDDTDFIVTQVLDVFEHHGLARIAIQLGERARQLFAKASERPRPPRRKRRCDARRRSHHRAHLPDRCRRRSLSARRRQSGARRVRCCCPEQHDAICRDDGGAGARGAVGQPDDEIVLARSSLKRLTNICTFGAAGAVRASSDRAQAARAKAARAKAASGAHQTTGATWRVS